MDLATLILKADTRDLKKAESDLGNLAKTGERTEKATANQTSKMARSYGQVSGAMAAAGKAAAALGISLAAGAAMSKAMQNAREFGSALSEVSTLIEGTAKQTAYLNDESKRLAATYGGTGTEQAKAFYQAISAGAQSVEAAGETLDVANRLAIGGVTDVTTAVGILSTAMNVYAADGLTAADASDAIFVAVKAGVTTVGELSSAMGKVLPLAEKMGLTFDETAAATAALTKGGLSTAEAVTGLRASLVAVLAPTTAAQKIAAQLGLDFSAAGLEARGFAGFMAEVVAKTDGSAEKMQALFGSVEAVGAALAFSGSAGESMAAILDDMGNKAGATTEAFNKMSEDMQQRLNVVMGKLWGLSASFGSTLLTVMVPALEAAVGAFSLLAENADALGVALGILAATRVPALIASLVTLATWLGTAEGLFIAGAIAARGMSIAMNLIPGVAVFTGLTIALTGMVRGFGESTRAANVYQQSIGNLVGVQESLNNATETYYQNMTSANLKALKLQAELARDAVKVALEAAQAELEAAGFFTRAFGTELWDTSRMADARAAIAALSGDLVEAEARLDAATVAAESMDSSLLDSEDSARGLVHASGLITFDGAAAGAAELAKWLGISLSHALALAATTPAMADEDALMSQQVIPDASMRADQQAAVDSFNRMTASLNKVGSAGSAAGSSISKGMKDAEKAATKLADEIERLEFQADPMKKYNAELKDLNKLLDAGLSEGAYNKELEKMNGNLVDQLPLVNDLSNAWGDFVVSGLSDWKGFADSIWSSFKSLLSNMISTAAKNKVVIGLGASGSIGGTAASAATGGGGLLGNLTGGGGSGGILGSIGGLGAAFGQGFSNTIAATFGAGGGLMSGIASAGAQVGTALAGGSIASIGAAVGAVAPYALLAYGAFKLLKGAFKRTYASSGYYGTLTAGGLQDGREDRHYKGSTFKSGKTTSNPLGADLINGLSAASQSLVDSTTAAARSLNLSTAGIGSAAGVQFGYAHNAGEFSQEAMDQAIQTSLQQLANNLARSVLDVNQYWKGGAEEASEVLQRLAASLQGVNAIFTALDRTLLEASITGAAAASRLVDAFGSLETMAELSAGYYQNFYSEGERAARVTRDLTTAFADMGYALPTSREGFRALVDSIDVTTQAGANLYASMLGMSGALSSILPAFDAVTDATRKLVRDLLNDADLAASSYAQKRAREGMNIADAMRAAQDGDITSVREYLRDARAGSGSDLEYRKIASQVLAQLGVSPNAANPEMTSGVTAPVRDAQAARNDILELGLQDLRSEMAGLRDENRQLGLRADRYLKQIADLAEKNDKIGTPPERQGR